MSVTSLRKTERDDKRELILDEASAQFNERGFHDVRLEDIADALGATKASISYHFQSKGALLEAAYLRSCTLLDAAIARAGEDGTDAIATWSRAVAQMQSRALLRTEPQLAILNDLDALGDDCRSEIQGRIAAQIAALERFLEAAGPDAATRGAALLMWTMPGWIGPWLAAIPPRRHAKQIEAFVALLGHGLAGDPQALASTSFTLASPGTDLLFNREERARLKRDAFERAGIRRFNKHGYAGFSLNALADELGASRSTFYYTFADKDALLEACAHRSHARLLSILGAVDDATGPMLPNIASGLARLYSEHVSNLEPMLRGCIYSSLSSGKEAIADADWQGIAARLARLLAECSEEGGCIEHGVEKLEIILLSALRHIAVSPGLAGFPGGNPFGNAQPEDYFAPFFRGVGTASWE